MMPIIIGISSRPDSVGVAPLTSCRYSGSVLSAPNMPRPISTFTLRPMLNTRLWNSRIGISASSFIRISIRMKAMTPTMPSAIRPSTAGEAQPHSRPCSATISSGTRPTISAAAPHQSMRWSCRMCGMCSTSQHDDQRDDADRHVDQEDPAPAGDAQDGARCRRRSRRPAGR